jgi:hypothetical protein
MTEIVKDIRVSGAVNTPVKTSLTEFMSKAESNESTDSMGTEGNESTSTDDTNVVTGEVDSQPETSDTGESSEGTEKPTSEGTEDQSFEVKGQKILLKDLLNTYETRQEISRRFDDIGKREQKLRQQADLNKKERDELDFINEKFAEMHELVAAGQPIAALQIALALKPNSAADTPTLEKLIQQAVEIADNFHNMSDDEKKLFLEKEQFQVEKRKVERESKKIAKTREEIEVKAHYETVLDQLKVTDEELDTAHSDIQNIPKYAEHLGKLGPKERINYCAQWVLGQRLNSTIKTGIAQVDPSLAENQKFRLAILEVIDPRCTVDDVAAVVRAYNGTTENSAKVTAASTQGVDSKPTTPNRAPTKKPEAEKSTPVLSYADIIKKYS